MTCDSGSTRKSSGPPDVRRRRLICRRAEPHTPWPYSLLYEDSRLCHYHGFLGGVHTHRAKRRSEGEEKRRKRISNVLRWPLPKQGERVVRKAQISSLIGTCTTGHYGPARGSAILG